MLIFLGDVHGKWDSISEYISNYAIEKSNIIQVGDFGIGFKNMQYNIKHLTALNDFLLFKNNYLYIFRGNHDDPSFFKKDIFQFSNIRFVSDYTLLEFKEADVLCVGGAISIDRKQRTVGFSYWEDEKVVWDEQKLTNVSFNPNKKLIVATHTAPQCVNVNKNGTHLVDMFAQYDSNLWKDINVEREILQKIHDYLKQNNISFTDWFMGHFHNSYLEIQGNSKFHILDELEFKLAE